MKRLLIAFAGIVSCSGVVGPESARAAEKYPVKPITCIVGVEAGADGDVLVRPVMQGLSKLLGQPIVIVNKPGGGSTFGYRELLNAKPDGYSLLLPHTNANTIYPATHHKDAKTPFLPLMIQILYSLFF